MKRVLTVALAATLMLGLFAPMASAGRFNDECRYWMYNGRPGYTDGELEKAARCFAKKFAINADKFVFIIEHESGFTPSAINRSSGACGLMQFYPCSKHRGLLHDAKIARPKLKPYGDAYWKKPRQALAAGAILAKRTNFRAWCDFTSYC